MTTHRTIYSGFTQLHLFVNTTDTWVGSMADELVVSRPFRRSVHLWLKDIRWVELQGLNPYTDQRPLSLVVDAASLRHSWKLKRYANLQPLENFVETLSNLIGENDG